VLREIISRNWKLGNLRRKKELELLGCKVRDWVNSESKRMWEMVREKFKQKGN